MPDALGWERRPRSPGPRGHPTAPKGAKTAGAMIIFAASHKEGCAVQTDALKKIGLTSCGPF